MSSRLEDIILAVLVGVAVGAFVCVMQSCGLEGDDRSPYCLEAQDPDPDGPVPICEPASNASTSPSPSPEAS